MISIGRLLQLNVFCELPRTVTLRGLRKATQRRRHAELVASGLTDAELERFHHCTQKGLPTGSRRFKAEVEAALARQLGNGRRDRPNKRL